MSGYQKKFRFSWLISLATLILAIIMGRLSLWQWHRHLEKKDLIQQLNNRLDQPPQQLNDLLTSGTPLQELTFRRVYASGTYDFSHEMVLRNRRHEGIAGVYVLTPLRLADSRSAIIVNRGFLPLALAEPSARRELVGEANANVLLLLKNKQPAGWLAPKDPPSGQGFPWVDGWLRVDLDSISKQLPYQILPIYGEVMDTPDIDTVRQKIIRSDSERNEILSLASRKAVSITDSEEIKEPIPAYDIVIPPGRHLGYVFEWAFMALGTIIIGILVQRRG